MTLDQLKKIDFSIEAKKVLHQNVVLLEKISKSTNLEADKAEILLQETLKFLYLVGATELKLTPSLLVDYAWHELILFTKFYMDYCNELFGRYIHHHPGGKEEENRLQFKNTLKIYTLTFGSPSIEYWGHEAEQYQEADCGADF